MTHYAGRILAIDYGSKRVGVAVSDPMRVIAQGVTTLANDPRLINTLCALIQSKEASLVLVGMPYGPDGSKGAKANEVEQFIADLQSATEVPIETWDESYSSVNAQRRLIEAGMKMKQRRDKGRIDEMAARVFLQEYLDSLPGTLSPY